MVRQSRIFTNTRTRRLLVTSALVAGVVLGANAIGGSAPLPPLPDELPPERLNVLGVPDGRTHQAKADALTAECMADRGFNWVPRSGVAGSIPAFALSPDVFTNRFGYGIATGVTDPAFQPAENEDPNLRTFEDLTPDEQREYEWALMGNPANAEEVRDETGRVIAIIQPDSCIVQADEALLGPQRERALNLDRTEMIRFEAAEWAEDDPRLRAARREWSECMLRFGHEFDTPAEARQYFIDAGVGLGLNPGYSERISFDSAIAGPLADLQRLELAVARADAECDAETSLSVTEWRVRRAYEIELGG